MAVEIVRQIQNLIMIYLSSDNNLYGHIKGVNLRACRISLFIYESHSFEILDFLLFRSVQGRWSKTMSRSLIDPRPFTWVKNGFFTPNFGQADTISKIVVYFFNL